MATGSRWIIWMIGMPSVDVKVLTGDNEIITAYICKEVGMPVENLLLGSQIEAMSETQLADAAKATSVFARLAPAHKERIIVRSRARDTCWVSWGMASTMPRP